MYSGKLFKKSSIFVILIILSLYMVCLCPVSAFAFDLGYVNDPLGWDDQGNIIYYEDDDFSGFLKYIDDVQNGCFYTYLYFSDYSMCNEDESNIVLSFRIENSNESYKFCVNKDGLTNESDRRASEKVKVYYNFDVKCTDFGGQILVGFEFLDKNDKVLNNRLRCELAYGLSSTRILFDGFDFDMSVNAVTDYDHSSQKTTVSRQYSEAVNKTTSKTSTKHNSLINKYTTLKADTTGSISTTYQSTKFAASGTSAVSSIPSHAYSESSLSSSGKYIVSGDLSSTTKFADKMNSSYDGSYNSAAVQSDDSTYQSEALLQGEIGGNNSENSAKMSKSAKACLAAAASFGILGTAFCIAGCVKKQKIAVVSEKENEKSN